MCASCRLTRYCGRACQLAHWIVHRSDCRRFCSLQTNETMEQNDAAKKWLLSTETRLWLAHSVMAKAIIDQRKEGGAERPLVLVISLAEKTLSVVCRDDAPIPTIPTTTWDMILVVVDTVTTLGVHMAYYSHIFMPRIVVVSIGDVEEQYFYMEGPESDVKAAMKRNDVFAVAVIVDNPGHMYRPAASKASEPE